MRNEREGMWALNIGMIWNIVCVVNGLHEGAGHSVDGVYRFGLGWYDSSSEIPRTYWTLHRVYGAMEIINFTRYSPSFE